MPTSGPMREFLPGRSLMILQNPGRGSSNYIEGVIAGAKAMGLRHCVVQLGDIWSGNQVNRAEVVRKVQGILVQNNVGAMAGYGFNGAFDVQLDQAMGAQLRSFFEIRGIVHLMLWIDHPHWHADLYSFKYEIQNVFRSGSSYHFLKSAAHALELERVLGWPNCFELPAAIESAQLTPVRNAEPEFDIVAICGEKAELPEWMRRFILADDPEEGDIVEAISREIRPQLHRLWQTDAPAELRPELSAMSDRWVALKCQDPSVAAVHHLPQLAQQFPGPIWWLTVNFQVYMKALCLLWRLREWQRRFYAAWLSRFYKVAVFGGDWTSLSEFGLQARPGWIDFKSLPATYARGKLALNIIDGHDEEGLTIKSFEIAASGVPMLHYYNRGLENCFDLATEVASFRSPREAKALVADMLSDEPRRAALATSARQRAGRDHNWQARLRAMFSAARLPIDKFMA